MSGYQDVPMTRRRAQLLEEYASKLADMLEAAPHDKDLAEWVQSKVDRAAAAIQSAYHYLDQDDESDLEKARVLKYDYRRPSKTRFNKKTGKREWDYFYTKKHGARVTRGAFEAGAAFRMTWKGRKGHFHIHHVKGDQVFITHDSRPNMEPVPVQADELRALLERQHKREVDQHLKRKTRKVEEIKRRAHRGGLGLALHRLRQAAAQAGVSLPEQYQRKPKKTRARLLTPSEMEEMEREDRFEGFNNTQRTALNKIVSEIEALQREKSYNKSRNIGPLSVQNRIEQYISSSFLKDQGLSEEDQESLRNLVSHYPVSSKVFDLIQERASKIDLDPETMRSQLESFISSTVTDTLKILSSEADDRQSKRVRLALKRFETPQTKQEQARHFFDVLGITGFKGRRLSVDGDIARVDIKGKDNKIGFVEFTEQGVNFDSLPELKEDQKEAFNEAREDGERFKTETPREVEAPRDQLTSTAQQIIEDANQEHEERHEEHQEITRFELGEHTHTRTGQKLFTAKQTERVERDEYFRRLQIAKKHGGRYERRYVRGFVFKSAEDARAFALEVEGAAQEAPETSAETVTPHDEHPGADNFETMPEVESAGTPKRTVTDELNDIDSELFKELVLANVPEGARGKLENMFSSEAPFVSKGNEEIIPSWYTREVARTIAILRQSITFKGERTQLGSLLTQSQIAQLREILRPIAEAHNERDYEEVAEGMDRMEFYYLARYSSLSRQLYDLAEGLMHYAATRDKETTQDTYSDYAEWTNADVQEDIKRLLTQTPPEQHARLWSEIINPQLREIKKKGKVRDTPLTRAFKAEGWTPQGFFTRKDGVTVQLELRDGEPIRSDYEFKADRQGRLLARTRYKHYGVTHGNYIQYGKWKPAAELLTPAGLGYEEGAMRRALKRSKDDSLGVQRQMIAALKRRIPPEIQRTHKVWINQNGTEVRLYAKRGEQAQDLSVKVEGGEYRVKHTKRGGEFWQTIQGELNKLLSDAPAQTPTPPPQPTTPREQLTETARQALTETAERVTSDQTAEQATTRATPRPSEATLRGSGELDETVRANLQDRAQFLLSTPENVTKTGMRSKAQRAKDGELLLIYMRLQSDAQARLGPTAPQFNERHTWLMRAPRDIGINTALMTSYRAELREGIKDAIRELEQATSGRAESVQGLEAYRALENTFIGHLEEHLKTVSDQDLRAMRGAIDAEVARVEKLTKDERKRRDDTSAALDKIAEERAAITRKIEALWPRRDKALDRKESRLNRAYDDQWGEARRARIAYIEKRGENVDPLVGKLSKPLKREENRRARRVQKSARPLITYRAQLIQTVERLTA